MRRYSQRQTLSSLSEINITPLLDLAFVLLIIFMITTPLLESSVSLIIPSSGAKNPPVTSSPVQTISIDRNESIQFNNQVVDLDALTAQLVELKHANPDVAIAKNATRIRKKSSPRRESRTERPRDQEEDRPLLTSAPSEIQLPAPIAKPSTTPTATPKPAPKVKATPKPTSKPTPKPTPKP